MTMAHIVTNEATTTRMMPIVRDVDATPSSRKTKPAMRRLTARSEHKTAAVQKHL